MKKLLRTFLGLCVDSFRSVSGPNRRVNVLKRFDRLGGLGKDWREERKDDEEAAKEQPCLRCSSD